MNMQYLFPLKEECAVSEQHNVLDKVSLTEFLNILNTVELE